MKTLSLTNNRRPCPRCQRLCRPEDFVRGCVTHHECWRCVSARLSVQMAAWWEERPHLRAQAVARGRREAPR